MSRPLHVKPTKQSVRTLWISDVHLGTRDCKAQHLASFLKRYKPETLYLVGDIIDGWRLRGGIYWPQTHSNVIRRLLTMSKRGTEVIYVTGNHDEFLRRYSKLVLGNIQLVDEAEHVTADGRRLLVIHGDQFDVITRYHKWLAFLGDSAYGLTLTLNRWLNHWRERWGYGYWSLSAYLKHKVKTAVSFISDFEEAIAHECVKRGLSGVVCGHIHHAEIRRVGAVEYHNCGDWVESCTALIEHWDGHIQLYRLAEEQALPGQSEQTSPSPSHKAPHRQRCLAAVGHPPDARWRQTITLSRSFSAAWRRARMTRSLSKFSMPLVSRYMEKPGSSCSMKLDTAPRSRRKSTIW